MPKFTKNPLGKEIIKPFYASRVGTDELEARNSELLFQVRQGALPDFFTYRNLNLVGQSNVGELIHTLPPFGYWELVTLRYTLDNSADAVNTARLLIYGEVPNPSGALPAAFGVFELVGAEVAVSISKVQQYNNCGGSAGVYDFQSAPRVFAPGGARIACSIVNGSTMLPGGNPSTVVNTFLSVWRLAGLPLDPAQV